MVTPALPVVAVVGRPNVGKSTLFNRVVGGRSAIVQEEPGVTRDRHCAEAEWNGLTFTLVDTGGWRPGGTSLDRSVSEQAEAAVRHADLVVFVVDATVGLTGEDEEVVRWLRRAGREVLTVANKVDSASREGDAWAVARAGTGSPWMVSALHGRGTGDLLDEVARRLSARGWGTPERSDQAEAITAVAVVGRPNVGKSTLFNRLAGEERSVTHSEPGTTRDSVDTVVENEVGTFRFIDTAGMRRRGLVSDGTEYYSLVRALRSVDRADVALLVLDAAQGVTHQDQRLGERVDAAGSPVITLLNKWDLVGADRRQQVRADVADRLGFLGYAPVLRVSGLTGLGVGRIWPALSEAVDAYRRRLPTHELNRIVQAAQAAHPERRARVLYAVQGATDPPTITLFSNRRVPPAYLRYLERRIREHFGLGPSPLKLRVRSRASR